VSKFIEPERTRKVAAFAEAIAAVEQKFDLTLDLPKPDREGVGVIDPDGKVYFAIVRTSATPGAVLLGMGA
jgi:hypothetical protein